MWNRHAVSRRAVLGLAFAGAFAATAPAAFAGPRAAPEPIVFVHGNGDSAAAWVFTMWRWESNGYPRDRLFAVNLRYPTAPFMEDLPQPGTSTPAEQERQLSAYVAEVLERTGAKSISLVGNSRGANTIRNFVKNGGGAAVTSHVVLGGGTNHGAFNWGALLDSAEFNGGGRFMAQLNSGPNEVVDGVDFLTIRSDFFDKYAQPNGRFLVGDASVPTFISYDAPELKGAKNLVVPGIDHRESAMGPDAFEATFAFVTGEKPETVAVAKEARPRLDGRVTGLTAGLYDNVPVAGAKLRIFKVDRRTGQRLGGPVHRVTTGDDGGWGPFRAEPTAFYEFELDVAGQPVTHIYRSPFLRGSAFVNLRPAETVQRPDEGSVVILSRPSGYFGIQDVVLLDGERPAFSRDRVPNIVAIEVRTPFAADTHVARFRDQKIAVRNWPEGHVAIAEFND